jgi:alpha-D-ribose 1-methylphosphonate 5-triphosphate synthase subunit PhnH
VNLDRIRSDVEALASMTCDSAGPGERASAAWLADRLRAAGAQTEVQPYRGAPTYAHHNALLAGAALLASFTRAPLRAATALAALAAWELDASGRARPLRRLLPRGEGANVVARVPARGRANATLVVVSHHDAARTGVMWSPRMTQAGAKRHLRRRRVDPFAAPVAAALLATAAGFKPARALLAATLALQLDVARSPTVPGACDNATGVATALELVRQAPLRDVDLVVVLPGGEEAGMEGFAAALRRLDPDPSTTLVLGLDTLGAGTPIVLSGEGALLEHRYADVDLRIADEGAALAGEPPPQRWRIGGWTDPLLALHRGLPTLSLLSMGPGYFPHYHHPSDTPDNVDWHSVERCARIAHGIARAAGRRRVGW